MHSLKTGLEDQIEQTKQANIDEVKSLKEQLEEQIKKCKELTIQSDSKDT